MQNPPLIIFCGSNQQGGAESQLCKLIESFQEFEIYLLIFSKNNKFGFFKKIKPKKNINLFIISASSKIKTYKNLYRILVIISQSKTKPVLMGWLAKGNLLALFVGLIKFRKTSVFCSHRSKFELNQSFKSKVLLFSTLFLYMIYPKKITHIVNAKEIADRKIIKFFLRGEPLFIQNCYEIKKEIPFNKNKMKDFSYLKLLIVARFSKEKGYELLFNALKKLNFPYKLKCIGSGCTNENKDFKNLCTRLDIKVSACESSKNLSKEYQYHDFLLLPSYSEASPNVIVESILEGTPAIITPTGPFIHLLKKYGLVSKKFNSEDFANAIKKGYQLKKDLKKYNNVRKELFLDIKNYILSPSKAANAYKKAFFIIKR